MAANDISSNDRRAFTRDFRLLLENHPKFAGRIALAEIPAPPQCTSCVSPVLGVRLSRSRSQPCVKWGKDPVTGERVCLKFADAT